MLVWKVNWEIGWLLESKHTAQLLSRVWLFATPLSVATQAPLCVKCWQENWSRLPFLTPGDLPDLGIKPASVASPALAGFFITGLLRKPNVPEAHTMEQTFPKDGLFAVSCTPFWKCSCMRKLLKTLSEVVTQMLHIIFKFIYLFYFTILYWFCHTLTWILHGCTCVCHPEAPSHHLPHLIPLGHPSAPALSTLSHATNLNWWFISPIIIYMFQCHSPILSYPHPLPQCPKDCSIHLSLFCCLAYRVIVTIFLNSIYICVILYWWFSFWLTSLCIIGSSFIHLIRSD